MATYIVRHTVVTETTIEAGDPDQALAEAKALLEGGNEFDSADWDLQVYDEGKPYGPVLVSAS